MVHWELARKCNFEAGDKCYEHESESVLENEDYKILWDFSVQTDTVCYLYDNNKNAADDDDNNNNNNNNHHHHHHHHHLDHHHQQDNVSQNMSEIKTITF